MGQSFKEIAMSEEYIPQDLLKDQLWNHAYQDLKKLAHYFLANKNGVGKTLSPTALVHEVYMKLLASEETEIKNKNHFIAVCCNAMRWVIVQDYRKKNTDKRGGAGEKATLSENIVFEGNEAVEVLALNQGLERLEQLDQELARIVEMRFFGGLTTQEVADALEVTTRTVERKWLKAKVFLMEIMAGKNGE